MAPKGKVAVAVSVSVSVADGRVIRRSTRLAAATSASPAAANPEPPKEKKTKTRTTSTAAVKKGEPEVPAADPEPSKKRKTKMSKAIIIEHCKQCNAFKTRAVQVKNALEKDVAGVNVVVNPEKQRRGYFEIREEGGDIFVNLLDMKRPFPPLKKLDMEKLISDIVKQIQ